MGKIILVTGGQRCGKSVFAENLALSLSPSPVYIATAEVRDEEFRERVRIHQERRGQRWTNIEEPICLSSHCSPGMVALVDCVTLWAMNAYFSFGEDKDKAFTFMEEELRKMSSFDATYIFVTNEIGLGGVSENEMRRRFTDLQGLINQAIAAKAEEVYFVVSGIPMKIK